VKSIVCIELEIEGELFLLGGRLKAEELE